jgi:hypothetical protein
LEISLFNAFPLIFSGMAVGFAEKKPAPRGERGAGSMMPDRQVI